jgi:hypothetical protein
MPPPTTRDPSEASPYPLSPVPNYHQNPDDNLNHTDQGL